MPDSDPLPSSYADLRKLVERAAYAQALDYLSWHNRLPMTEMLTVWQALVVAFAAENKTLDPFFFTSIQNYFKDLGSDNPRTIDECRELADRLVDSLTA